MSISFAVPLFWSQPGYSLKPAPILSADRSHAQNVDALRRHFSRTVPRYGPLVGVYVIVTLHAAEWLPEQTIVNLAEQNGKEGVITAAYRDFVHELNAKDVR